MAEIRGRADGVAASPLATQSFGTPPDAARVKASRFPSGESAASVSCVGESVSRVSSPPASGTEYSSPLPSRSS